MGRDKEIRTAWKQLESEGRSQAGVEFG